MRKRLLTTILLWLVIVLTLTLGGLLGGQILLMLVALGALQELSHLLNKLKFKLCASALLISLFLIFAGHFWGAHWHLVGIATALAIIITMAAHWREDLKTFSVAIMALLAVAIGLGSLYGIACLPTVRPLWHVVWVVGVIKLADGGAYLVGTHLGRQLLMPAVSPKKTCEGLFGAVLCGLIVGVMGAPLFHELWLGPVLGMALAVVGSAGDMLESFLKRSAKVKDSGKILPGIGGMLDLCDSLITAAPVAYLAIRFWN